MSPRETKTERKWNREGHPGSQISNKCKLQKETSKTMEEKKLLRKYRRQLITLSWKKMQVLTETVYCVC